MKLRDLVIVGTLFVAGYTSGSIVYLYFDQLDGQIFEHQMGPKLSANEMKTLMHYEMVSRGMHAADKNSILELRQFIELRAELDTAHPTLWWSAVWACAELNDEECMSTLSKTVDSATRDYWTRRLEILRAK